MQRSRKRKQAQFLLQSPLPIKSPSKPRKLITGSDEKHSAEPYPDHLRPTPEETLIVRDDLLTLHGFPKEFVKYRRPSSESPSGDLNGREDDGLNEKESVLDGLVSVILSQNTTDTNSHKAFSSLKSAFPTWEEVLAAESKCVEDTIRCGGLAPTKTACIKNMLSCLLERKGKLCFEYLRDMSTEEIKSELSKYKGIGPKTVACVLMFQLQRDDFPVDTHIFHIAKSIGWVPEFADIKKTYVHLNKRIPNELKFDLNCLMFTHGKLCPQCSKRGSNRLKTKFPFESCPLLNYRKALICDSGEMLTKSGNG
ncbi:putative DNA glycosylase At3g47830 [Impatiens glandulifera]|uniref:putative DNA glycosylase At3g47830 n=1 Tax=Impatiens glandulifera TaxID=253017 RepID=UPI001FB140D0|nr:putative DNA glycosylase At3g47830 [Impatiens glandulifera]